MSKQDKNRVKSQKSNPVSAFLWKNKKRRAKNLYFLLVVLDFALFVIPIGVLGARLYYVIMEIDSFDSIGEVFNIRNGGLAIYGGIIAGAITVFCVCKYKKINFLAFADCVVPGLIMAQAIGRWGNFMNGEAFGGFTDSFLRMGIRNINSYYTFGTYDMVYVHPTFLYESLWNLLGFILINLVYKKKKIRAD